MHILERLQAKRGYLLPYHRMLAAHNPELLARYDDFYEKLTLDQNLLAGRQKEFVWIAILAAAREGVGSLHLDRARAAGLSTAEMETSVALAALAEAFPAFRFGIEHWAAWLPAPAQLARYLALVETARGEVDPALAELALTVCHGIRLDRTGFALHLRRLMAAGGTPAELSEALSYLFIPMGANLLIEIVELWLKVCEAEPDLPRPY